MFYGCSSLKELDLSSFDTSQVTNMSDMFCECEALLTLDLSSFDTSQVADMSSMFYRCSSLKKLNVSSFNLNQLRTALWIFSGTDIKELILSDPRSS